MTGGRQPGKRVDFIEDRFLIDEEEIHPGISAAFNRLERSNCQRADLRLDFIAQTGGKLKIRSALGVYFWL